eukprot:m.182451 g.182451  ORF g.182451 m.182451 type:complete len:570 (-) comp14669_c0_seq1:401-2110(-)
MRCKICMLFAQIRQNSVCLCHDHNMRSHRLKECLAVRHMCTPQVEGPTQACRLQSLQQITTMAANAAPQHTHPNIFTLHSLCPLRFVAVHDHIRAKQEQEESLFLEAVERRKRMEMAAAERKLIDYGHIDDETEEDQEDADSAERQHGSTDPSETTSASEGLDHRVSDDDDDEAILQKPWFKRAGRSIKLTCKSKLYDGVAATQDGRHTPALSDALYGDMEDPEDDSAEATLGSDQGDRGDVSSFLPRPKGSQKLSSRLKMEALAKIERITQQATMPRGAHLTDMTDVISSAPSTPRDLDATPTSFPSTPRHKSFSPVLDESSNTDHVPIQFGAGLVELDVDADIASTDDEQGVVLPMSRVRSPKPVRRMDSTMSSSSHADYLTIGTLKSTSSSQVFFGDDHAPDSSSSDFDGGARSASSTRSHRSSPRGSQSSSSGTSQQGGFRHSQTSAFGGAPCSPASIRKQASMVPIREDDTLSEKEIELSQKIESEAGGSRRVSQSSYDSGTAATHTNTDTVVLLASPLSRRHHRSSSNSSGSIHDLRKPPQEYPVEDADAMDDIDLLGLLVGQ